MELQVVTAEVVCTGDTQQGMEGVAGCCCEDVPAF
jgi:hypothetical protein